MITSWKWLLILALTVVMFQWVNYMQPIEELKSLKGKRKDISV